MKELIEKFLIKNKNKLYFSGEVYTYNQNIDRNVINRLIDKYNIAFEKEVLTPQDNYLAVFINDTFKDYSSRLFINHYSSSIINERHLISLTSIKTHEGYKKIGGIKIVRWDEIDEIQLLENNNKILFFRFFITHSTDTIDITSIHFATSNLRTCRELLRLFNSMIDLRSNYQEQVNNLIGLEKYQEALNLTNDVILKEENIADYSRDYVLASMHKPKLLLLTDELDESLKAVNDLIRLCDELKEKGDESVDEGYFIAYKLKSEIYYETQQFDLAIKNIGFCEKLIKESSNNFISKGDAKEINEAKTKYYNVLVNKFLKISAHNRKQIFISNELHPSENFFTLKKQNLPLGISFPFGHPHLNNLYTCHPLKQNYYIPLAKIQQELFKDRISEFCYLMQCLGATKIEINTFNNKSVENNSKSSLKADAKLDFKAIKANTNYEKDKEIDNKQIELLGIKKIQTFKPIDEPYIPEDLIWYNSETSWQRLVNQRMKGNIETHTENIVSTFNEVVTNNEITKINAELKFLLPKVGVNYSAENEINANGKETLEWAVSVQFQDKELLEQKKVTEITNKKEEIEKYKADILLMLEDDNIIDENERRILNRKIKKYGLSQNEAKNVENKIISNHFNESELLYIEELKDFLDDGKITEVELKILDRYAKKYGLNNETKKKMNNIFIK